MRKSHFTEEPLVKILREADRLPVADVSKKHGVSEQTIYTWRKRFGAMSADKVKHSSFHSKFMKHRGAKSLTRSAIRGPKNRGRSGSVL